MKVLQLSQESSKPRGFNVFASKTSKVLVPVHQLVIVEDQPWANTRKHLNRKGLVGVNFGSGSKHCK